MNPLKKKPRTKSISEPPAKPEWMKKSIRFPLPWDSVQTVREDLDKKKLNTVCESASCPNLNHCWSRKTATYMLNGDICTRRCGYCDVAFGKPQPLDLEEPIRIAESALHLNLRYIVLTAVNRDDLKDGGVSGFTKTIEEIKKRIPDCQIEVLIPDFRGNSEILQVLYDSKPDIINHNIETVESLFPKITPQKNYQKSLSVLKDISSKGFITKSGLILGMGEDLEEVKICITDLKNSGVSVLTIGQYLQPTITHHPISEYRTPEEFQILKDFAKSLGFRHVESGPLVRSSYHADEQMESIN